MALELMLAHYLYGCYQIMPEPMLSHRRCKCMHEQSSITQVFIPANSAANMDITLEFTLA